MTPQQLAAEIEASQFTPVRFTEGYAMEEVDAFLDVLVRGLRDGLDVREHAASAPGFTRVRLREGYRIAEVDALLKRVRTAEVSAPPPASPPGPRFQPPPATSGLPSIGDAGHPTHQVLTTTTDRLRRRLRKGAR